MPPSAALACLLLAAGVRAAWRPAKQQAAWQPVSVLAAHGGQLLQKPLDSIFFREDAEKMAEVPEYDEWPERERPLHPSAPCQPRCTWKCVGKRECNQVCQPACLPPECKTVCKQSSNVCETRCAPPQCAVVCPPECTDGKCGKCGTVCNEPVCTTQCAGSCDSICDKPKCLWTCQQGMCPEPKCHLDCSEPQVCRYKFPPTPNRTARSRQAERIMSEADAAMTASALLSPLQPPGPWAMQEPKKFSLRKATLPPPTVMVTSTKAPETTTEGPTTPGPVAVLKARWAAEDAAARAASEA